MQKLVEVTGEKFFEELKKDMRDIMPIVRGSYPYISDWRTNNMASDLFGKSTEGKYWLMVEDK